MYLAENRVGGKCDVNVVDLRFLYNASVDPMLGTGVEALRRGGAWYLHYVKSAYAYPDIPDQVRVGPSWNELAI